MPNMPATVSTWIRLAPETLRERKIRSGTNGLRAVASRTTKPASRASASPARRRVAPAVQPCSAAGLTMV